MSTTVQHILDYVALLEREFSLTVTLHDNYLCERSDLAELNIHSHPYCLCMKTNTRLWNECVERQKLIREKCRTEGRFFGMCHAGVCEYVYPIGTQCEPPGFVSVSGYRGEAGALREKAQHKLTKLSAEYGLDYGATLELHEKLLSPRIPPQELVDALIYPLCDMLVLYYGELSAAAPTSDTSRARQKLYYEIANHIRLHHNGKIDLAYLSERLNYSKSYISHVFKSHSGMTINRYVNTLRIAEAKAMLSATELPVQEIALTIGYSDSNYFSNIFRDECGMSPREWRKQRRE